MVAYPAEFIPIEDAYEQVVAKLAPEARPGDEYLVSLSEDEADAAYAKIDEAERTVEAKFRNALADRKLSVWHFVDYKEVTTSIHSYSYGSLAFKRVPTWKEWRRPAFGVPSVGFRGYYDHTIDGFVQPSPPGGKNFFLKERDFKAWLRRQRRRKPKAA